MEDLSQRLADWTGLGEGSATLLLVSAGFLLAGTLYRLGRWWIVRRRRDDVAEERRQRLRSAGTWWMLFLGGALLLSLGLAVLLPLLAVLSFLLLRETLPLARRIEAKDGPPWTRPVAIAMGVSGPLFLAAVALLPAPDDLPDERFGWLLLLLFLTELNDITQAWWGRLFGRHKMTPRLSPGKTWEGLAGGFASTMVATVVVAPVLTSYGREIEPSWLLPCVLGFAVSLSGILGDLSASWLKRRAGVKDAGRSLPGHGGFLDRFDSLNLTAPTYYLLSCALYVWGAPS